MTNDNRHNGLSIIAKAQGAFLGAAVGDALGWPQEIEAKRIDRKATSAEKSPVDRFQRWVRRSGGQYYPHEEVILPGEYSDDTQLILCTARSLLFGQQWWHHLTKKELPTWTCYERGGGGATKRAAKQWLAGKESWSAPKAVDNQKYFNAGGNGVAMRILPHCLLGATETNFGSIAKNVVANGVCTHGHPRALVGAVVYSFAVWIVLREKNTLTYGAIIDRVLEEVKDWSELPELDDIFPTWKPAAKEVNAGEYQKNWRSTVDEMKKLLEQCQQGMKQGALPVDREVLTQLGCFSSHKGAGTVSAAAAIFLALRYAADPINGLKFPAFAFGSDTDTIASMTGGILGAVHGIEWLGDYADRVQDAKYIRELAANLVKNQGAGQGQLAIETSKKHLDAFLEKLAGSKNGDMIVIPDGRKASISDRQQHKPLSRTTVASYWEVRTVDGQTLYITKVSRQKNEMPNVNHSQGVSEVRDRIDLQPVKVFQMKVKLLVVNLEKARDFYVRVLGLKVEKESKGLVRCDRIVLKQLNNLKSSEVPRNSPERNATICLEIKSLEPAYNNAVQFGVQILQDISSKQGMRFFRCLDPDGNPVEIYQEEYDF